MKEEQLGELILQSLEHEMGGVKVYEMAVVCASNAELRREWEKNLAQTKTHLQILRRVCEVFGLDPEAKTTGRDVVRTVRSGLIDAMKLAMESGNAEAAQLVACECVVLAEVKVHLDWELLGRCAEKLSGPRGLALKEAFAEAEEHVDEHLYHSQGWCRELWVKSLGLRAILPPPEEMHLVKIAIGAAWAHQPRAESR